MKKIKIGSCKYIYYNIEDTYMLIYDPSDDWVDEVKGKVAYKIVDTGNGLEITQNKKNFLDYEEVVELTYLLNIITKK